MLEGMHENPWTQDSQNDWHRGTGQIHDQFQHMASSDVNLRMYIQWLFQIY